MNTSDPLTFLLSTLNLQDPFTDSSKKIASFIRKTEERFEAPQLILSLLQTNIDSKQQEYILFCFLDISRADFDILEQAVQLRQLRRLIAKAHGHPERLSETEEAIIRELTETLHCTSIDHVVLASRTINNWILKLSQGEEIDESQRTQLALLICCEAAALKARTSWLSEHVDAYNMRAIARLLPLLTVCDEQTCSLTEIGKRIIDHKQLGRAVLTLEYAMRTDSFEKWKHKVSKDESLKFFIELLNLQRTRNIPIRALVAVSTLSRRCHSPDTPPLTWLRYALESCTADGFRMNIGTNIDRVKPLLDLCHITPSGSFVSGTFRANSFVAWIGPDMLTRQKSDDEVEPSPKELVMRCMNNDALLLRLLDNPRIFGKPGLVEKIAYTSRSMAVLQKIATVKELYTGHANSGVPLALLKNPAHIPLNQIRPFINVRYVSLNDMKVLLHNPHGIRREVFSEIKTFIGQRYR
jgi:hypothetical protein